MRKGKLSLLTLSALALAVLGVTLLKPERVSAAYDGGNLIDNAVFLDSASMSIADIQNFLVSKGSGLASRNFVLNCYGADSKERQWYTAAGAPCDQNVPASTIIYYASQIYGINPKAVLATLQKEQSLITTANPTDWQINQAMGYGCPTSGGCGASNFFYQIDSGVWVLRYHYERARGNMQWWSPSTSWVCGTAKAYYNPNLYPNQNVNFVDEDGVYYRTHYLANAATSSLYCYTPHTYNNPQGLYGLPQYGTTGRYYSGSYNFVRFYELWFGSVHTPSFDWSLVSQSLYTDSSKSSNASNSMVAGTKVYAVIRVKNTGNQTWTKNNVNTVRMGAIRPLERRSPFCDPSWLSCSRPAGLNEASVAPDEIGTFEFWMTAPSQGGSFSEYFGPVVEGVAWLRDIGLFYTLHTQLPIYSWQMTSQYAYTDQNKTTVKSMGNLQPGEKVYVGFTAKNTGNISWQNNGPNSVMAGTYSPMERSSRFSQQSSWLTATRPTLLREASVAPGQTGTFEFWMTAPIIPGTGGVYHERFNLLANGITWMNDVGLSFYANVANPTYSWQIMSQYAYTDQNKTITKNLGTLLPGEKAYIGFTAKNTGTVTWANAGPNAILVGTANPLERISSFALGSSWLSGTRPTLLREASVAPGQTGTFEFWMTAPSTKAEFHERFNLISNGITWFNDTGLSFYTKVN